MTATQITGPVVCEPWCIDGNGHAGAAFAEDQTCFGEMLPVELSVEPVVEASALDEHGEWVACPDRLDVFAHRPGSTHDTGVTLYMRRPTANCS